jgi:hypothetical protein
VTRLADGNQRYRIRNTFSGLLVPGLKFEHLDEAYAWIAEQLRPQDFEVERCA